MSTETLMSVGIDVGTSTTQLVFSRLVVQNVASAYSVPCLQIVEKTIVYRSPVVPTPLVSPTQIDAPALGQIVRSAYQAAAITPDTVHTGAVIITGDTARASNADAVLKEIAAFAGDFVVTTAGPHLESVLAARGAGVDQYSAHHPGNIANLDIGGGTTNIAVYTNGELVGTSCVDIGGRAVRVLNERIVAITPPILRLAQSCGVPLAIGDMATRQTLMPLARLMASHLGMALSLVPRTQNHHAVYTNAGAPLGDGLPPTHLRFTGGVADCIQPTPAADPFRYGDIGPLLGEVIATDPALTACPWVTGAETIGATVVGAGIYTTELSGSTITYTPANLPLRNIPIINIPHGSEADPSRLAGAIREAIIRAHPDDPTQPVALALTGHALHQFTDIQHTATAIIQGAQTVLTGPHPLVVVIECDRAKALGQAIAIQRGTRENVICIDSVQTGGGDYIDIGTPVGAGRAVPVVVKTLVFNDTHGGEV